VALWLIVLSLWTPFWPSLEKRWGAHAVFSHVFVGPSDFTWCFLANGIGLAPFSTIQLDLTSDAPANDTYLMVVTHAQLTAWNAVKPMVATGHPNSKLSYNSYLASFWRASFYHHVRATVNINAPRRDRYYLAIFNAQQKPLVVHGYYSMINPGGEQLMLQEKEELSILMWAASAFLGTCFLFGGLFATTWRRARTSLHLLILIVIFLKALSVFLRWIGKLQVSKDGYESGIVDISWKLMEKVQTIAELLMFLFISLGWKVLRDELNTTEFRFAVFVSAFSLYFGVSEIVCTTESTCNGYSIGRNVLHTFCYLVVIVAMNLNLHMIHQHISDAPVSIETGKLYQMQIAYRMFRWLFLAFVIAPTGELVLKVSVIPWYALWMHVLIIQFRTWVVYTCVLMAFRPEPASLRVFELIARDLDDDMTEVDSSDELGGLEPE